MHYLIDGHNLIARLSDIRLSDADDEEQLVRRLQQWMAAGRKRRVTLYFDGGLPGGPAPHLSRGALKVIFASAGREADSLLIQRIRKVRNPPEFTLVSSDRAIVAAAQARGMPVTDAATFAQMMEEERGRRAAGDTKPWAKQEPAMDERELAEWLKLFGGGDGRN